ncbi:MAG TPA: copper resistance protein CopC [Actinomycetota bacterium]|nr:copper resistance protein CopC [Actinomycetota bacterium]
MTTPEMRRLRGIVIGVAVVLAMLALDRPASAHAGFVSSDPADGSTLASAPDAITIRFTEPPDPAISQIEVLDAGGGAVEVGPPSGVGRSGLASDVPDGLDDGVYTVNWVVVSTVDGHFTSGAFSFGVGEAGEVPRGDVSASSPDPTLVGVAGRAALYVGLSLVVASAVVAGWAFGRRPRSLRVVVVAGGVVALAGALLTLASEVEQIGTSTRTFLGSDTGAGYVRLLVAVGATAATAVLAAARPTLVTLGIAGAAAVAAWWARAASGHADGIAQTLGQTAHMTAVGIWIGGLLLLALLLRERRNDPPVDAVRRFSSIALVAVVVVIATGTIRALQETGGIGELGRTIDTGYGQVLAAKIALALVLVAFGAVNRRRSIPRIAGGDAAPLGRIVRAEVLVALGVALLTGTLTGLPPGGVGRSAPDAPPSISAEGSDFGTTVRVTLRATPGTAGSNTFSAEVVDFDTTAPADVDAVTLRFARAGADDAATAQLELERDGDRWTAQGSAMSIAGTWNVTAQIRTGAQVVDVPMILTTTTPGATTSVADVPGQPSITTVAYRDGRSAQLYVDPGAPGTNQVHVTIFDATGAELQLERASFVVVPPGGPARPADVLRFGPGHFVANVDLEEGAHIFDFTAVPVEGSPLQATLRATIGDAP